MKYLGSITILIVLAAILGLSVPQLSEAAQGPDPGEARLIESNVQHVVLEIAAPTLATKTRIVNGTTYLELKGGDWASTDTVGKPQLPVYGALVAVPQQARVTV